MRSAEDDVSHDPHQDINEEEDTVEQVLTDKQASIEGKYRYKYRFLVIIYCSS